MPTPDPIDVGDLTYRPTGEGGLSLAVILDLCSRAVVGWSMATHRRAARVHQALAMALCPRPPAAGLMLHPDRGSHDGADSARQRLAQHGLEPRMSHTGHGWHHAVAESFLHTLTTALVELENGDTHAPIQRAVFADIAVFYHRQRCHAAHGDLAPLASEHALTTHGMCCPEQC